MGGVGFFILKKKTTSLTEWPDNVKFLLAFLLAISMGVGYGILVGVIGDTLIRDKGVSVDRFIYFFSILLTVPTILIDIFPTLKSPTIVFKAYYPIRLKEKLKLELTSCFVRKYTLFLVCILTSTTLFSESIYFFETITTCLILLITYLLNRGLKVLLHFKIQGMGIIVTVYLGLFVVSLWLFWIMKSIVMLNWILAVIAFTKLGLFIYLESIKKEKNQATSAVYKRGLLFRVLSNKNMKILVTLAFGFKIIFMLLLSLSQIKNGHTLFKVEGFELVFITPLVLFTYFGCNVFGINKNFLMSKAIRINTIKPLFKLYFRIMIPFLSLDFALFLAYLFLVIGFSNELFFLYVTVTILFSVTGLLTSLLTPVIKEKYFSLDVNRHGAKTVSIIALIVVFGISAVVYSLNLFKVYWLIDLFFITGALLVAIFYPLDVGVITRIFFKKGRKYFIR